MKKRIVKVLLTAAVVTSMMLSVTACGAKNEAGNASVNSPVSSEQNATTPASAASTPAESTPAEASAESNADNAQGAADEGQMTLEEWTESDECVEFLEVMNEGMAEDNVQVFFEADGDLITMVYQYMEQVEVVDNVDEAVGALLESNRSLFESMRDQLIAETGNENTVLRIEYRNADDSSIFNQDY